LKGAFLEGNGQGLFLEFGLSQIVGRIGVVLLELQDYVSAQLLSILETLEIAL
jgi:hypothetical protein